MQNGNGLRLRNGVWHMQKRCRYAPSGWIRGSTGTGDRQEASAILARKLDEARQAALYGIRPARTFEQAATKYLLENQHKDSIRDDAIHLKQLMPYVGGLAMTEVHDGTLAPFVDDRLAQGIRPKSINNALGVVRRIMNLAARSWRDERGMTWIESAPLITMLPAKLVKASARKTYTLDWIEQRRLLRALPPHLARMALYKVNTGCREQEVCGLEWSWEVPVPEIGRSVFVLPQEVTKTDEERIVVLNDVAWSIVQGQRGVHHRYVFTYRGERIGKMNNTAWKRAWKQAGLPADGVYSKGVHNLRHTFGRRLRSAGVEHETRQALLGHTTGNMTTHYSTAEILELLRATQKIMKPGDSGPSLTVIRSRGAARSVAL